MTTVLLWDLDGTLITTGRAGIFAWEEAVTHIAGVEADFATLRSAGLTDREVAALCLETAGADTSAELVERVLREYERRLPANLPRRTGRVLEGVAEILERVEDRPDVLSLLLTGNTPAGAAAKLGHYGLDRFFPPGAGGFCAGPGPREEIAGRALARATELLGEPPEPERVYVIGDTPADVRAGRSIGARTIALATSVYSVEELAEHDPWLALPQLPAPDAFLALVGLARGG